LSTQFYLHVFNNKKYDMFLNIYKTIKNISNIHDVYTHYTVTTIDHLGEDGGKLKRVIGLPPKSTARFSPHTVSLPLRDLPLRAPLRFTRFFSDSCSPLRSSDFFARSAPVFHSAPMLCLQRRHMLLSRGSQMTIYAVSDLHIFENWRCTKCTWIWLKGDISWSLIGGFEKKIITRHIMHSDHCRLRSRNTSDKIFSAVVGW